MFASISNMACAFIGLVYPSYRAYRALKYSHGPNAELELLTVFIVCVAFTALCTAVLDPLFGSWLPLYHPAKLALTAWLVAPQTRGASILFTSRIEPFVRQLQEELQRRRGGTRDQ